MALSEIGIFFIKGMTINTMSFTSIYSGKANAAHLVFSVVHDFKVNRIHASTDTTKMVALLRRGQRAIYEHFPHYTVCVLGFAAHLNARVAVSVDAASPQPAGTALKGNGRVDLDLLKQSGYAGQKGVALDKRVLTRLAVTARSLATLLTIVSNAVTFSLVNIELGARFFNAAFTTSFERDRISLGHRCLQLGNVT